MLPSAESVARVRMFMASEPELASDKRVGADPLAAGELGQIALLLFLGAVPDQRQRGDAGVRAKRR